jgi:transposase InsO family protein
LPLSIADNSFADSWMNKGSKRYRNADFDFRLPRVRHDQPIAPNRLTELPETPQRPNEVWTADFAYLPILEEGWLHLAVEMDLYSKRLAG